MGWAYFEKGLISSEKWGTEVEVEKVLSSCQRRRSGRGRGMGGGEDSRPGKGFGLQAEVRNASVCPEGAQQSSISFSSKASKFGRRPRPATGSSPEHWPLAEKGASFARGRGFLPGEPGGNRMGKKCLVSQQAPVPINSETKKKALARGNFSKSD